MRAPAAELQRPGLSLGHFSELHRCHSDIEARPVRVPYDEIAEEEVIGVVVGSRYGAGLVLGRGVVADDFYKPVHARLFAAVAESEALPNIVDDDERTRIAAVAAVVEVGDVEALVRRRCVAWDEAGTFCRRVQAAARARSAMRALADAFNALGEGADVDEIKPLVEAVL